MNILKIIFTARKEHLEFGFFGKLSKFDRLGTLELNKTIKIVFFFLVRTIKIVNSIRQTI